MIQESPAASLPAATGHIALPESLQESYRTLFRQIMWSQGLRQIKTFGLTSCRPGAGVSMVAAHLAATVAAQGDQRVLLVDFNLASPGLHRIFKLPAEPGLAESLRDKVGDATAISRSSLPNLSLLTAGHVNGDAAQLFDTQHLDSKVMQWASEYDLVVFDMPPFGESNAATRLVQCLDGVALVIEAERTTWAEAARAKRQLQIAAAKLLGVVINKQRPA